MFILHRLEYRLLDESKGYHCLFYYDHITREEISARFACDYFIKDGVVYEKTSCAIEPLLVYVVYVQKSSDESAINYSNMHQGNILVEIREYKEYAREYPLLTSLQFNDYSDLILQLQADYMLINGKEYAKSSTEIDEDSKRFLIYVTPSQG